MMKIKYIVFIIFLTIFINACGDKEESETEKKFKEFQMKSQEVKSCIQKARQ